MIFIQRQLGNCITSIKFQQNDLAQRVIISTSAKIKDLRFIDISFSADEGEKLKFKENEELYTLDSFKPAGPLVVWVSFPGILPTRAVSFVDENGQTRTYAIAMSGEEGSLLLVEIQLSDS